MIALSWARNLLAHRRSRVLGVAIGVAVAVALIASIGTFLSATTSKMTDRAVATVATDWQVEAQSGANPDSVLKQVRAFDSVTDAKPVRFADTPGLSAVTGNSRQRTGSGKVVGLPPGFAKAFPGEIRVLAGAKSGVLLAQQTAANLDATPGQKVTIDRPGKPPASVTVDGIVEMPAADSFFQKVGAPIGSQPQAPPDNVILLPEHIFKQVEASSSGFGSRQISTQVFATVDHALPNSPNAAYTKVSGQARNLETRLAGNGLVGDNIGTALDGARSDALYAQILFLFLGLPGALIAGFVTAAISSAGASRRRRDAAMLRTRGASTRDLVRIALGETTLAAVLGVLVGLATALAVGKVAFGGASFGAGTLAAVLWAGGAAITGAAIAALAIVVPAWRDARSLTVSGQRRPVGRRDRSPWWARYGVDFLLLAAAALVFWQASRGGYKLVLAPEGVSQVSVNWYSLLAPVFAWIGGGLLVFRIATATLSHSRRPFELLLRPVAGNLSPTVAATMKRQHRLLASSVTLVALTVAFATSTAIFNSTYQQQAEVDARLSNGADVAVTESPGKKVDPSQAGKLAKISGVQSVEPLQHRFAYVGSDLQDLYGVRPATIGAAGELQNVWFQGGSASGLMKELEKKPDSVLVSAETVKDFQLHPNDRIRLRLQDSVTGKYTTVPFHYIGVANEFPTAPSDSFLVANGSYIAQQTGNSSVGSFLIQTDGTDPSTVANNVRKAVGTSAPLPLTTFSRSIIPSGNGSPTARNSANT